MVLMTALAGGALWPRMQARQRDPAPVGVAPIDDRGQANRLRDMGGTYYALESRARKVTIAFRDLTAVAERHVDGKQRASLRLPNGAEMASLTVERTGVGASELRFERGDEYARTRTRSDLQPTLAWANLQLLALHRDHPAAVTDLRWQQRFLRGGGSKNDDLEAEIVDVDTEFDGGITATTTRRIDHPELTTDRPDFVTDVFDNGTRVGRLWWDPHKKQLWWNFPGLTQGMVDAERQKSIGGWPFAPTPSWANIQGLAFYELHKRMKAEGSVADRNCAPAARPGALARLAEALTPILHADEVGCDYQHWLDYTIYRPCCDTHDRCYYNARPQCTVQSWYWPFGQGSWQCLACNAQVVFCILTSGPAYGNTGCYGVTPGSWAYFNMNCGGYYP